MLVRVVLERKKKIRRESDFAPAGRRERKTYVRIRSREGA